MLGLRVEMFTRLVLRVIKVDRIIRVLGLYVLLWIIRTIRGPTNMS